MPITSTEMRELFERYARASQDDDPEPLARMYAPTFLVGGPKGSAAFQNDERFRDWIRGVRAFDVQHGIRALQVVDIETTELSPIHRLARVTWRAEISAPGASSTEFRIAYLVEQASGGALVLAYVSEADQEDEMRRLGMI